MAKRQGVDLLTSGRCQWGFGAERAFLPCLMQDCSVRCGPSKGVFMRVWLCGIGAALGLFGATEAQAGKYYEVKYQSQAKYTAYRVKYESQANCKVYRVRYESQAGLGKWYRVDYESQADFTIYWVDYESQAKLKIYFVDYESQADCLI